jgi:hypothetical protein
VNGRPGREWHSALLTVHIRHLNIRFPSYGAPVALHKMKGWDSLCERARTGGLAYSCDAGDSALPEVARVPAFAGAFAGAYWLTLLDLVVRWLPMSLERDHSK